MRSHQKIKREKGEFIGAFAPYGYCKDPENKNCLVIDSYAADIVRKIFSWKIDGFSLGAIAEKLNVRHVQSPKEYKKANGENYNSFQHLFRNTVSGAISTFVLCLADIKGFFLPLTDLPCVSSVSCNLRKTQIPKKSLHCLMFSMPYHHIESAIK